ncbi:MAG: hypothetical protein ACLFWM_12925 [Actinomycetota bacterium]
MRTVILLTLLGVVACGNGAATDTETTSAGTEPPGSATDPSSTSLGEPTTSRPESTTSTTSTTADPSTTSTSQTTPPTGAVDLSRECVSPEGYSIAYPEGWSTNSGEVVAECGQFDPDTFQVPEGTDQRVAAVTAYVDPVPFSQVAAPQEERDAERAVTAIDGLQAVRLEYESTGEGLWPEGTPVTLYAIDVGGEADDATLIIDTIGLPAFDYERNQTVLDRMARSVDVDMPGVEDDPEVVARYGGGGGAFSVQSRISDGRACLRIPPEGEEVCTEAPASDQLHTIQLQNLEPVLAGVTGEDVFAVTAHLRDGTTLTVLPAPMGDRDIGGFSFTVGLSEIESFVLTDGEGNELRTITPGG